MEHEVDVFLSQDEPGFPPICLCVSYGAGTCKFEVAGPDVLANWLACLFQNRDLPFDTESDWLVLGRCGLNQVSFELIQDMMLLFVGPEPGTDDIGDAAVMFIPRELLDDLADGLARAHRRWVEQAAQNPP